MCSEFYFENDLETRVNTLENNKIMLLVCNVKYKEKYKQPFSFCLVMSDGHVQKVNQQQINKTCITKIDNQTLTGINI